MFDKDLSVKKLAIRRKYTGICYQRASISKKVLNNPVFSLKFVINLFSEETGGIQGTFLSVKQHFKIDQYFFELN